MYLIFFALCKKCILQLILYVLAWLGNLLIVFILLSFYHYMITHETNIR